MNDLLRPLCLAAVCLAVASPSEASLVAFWNFDELSGSTATDTVGGFNGTLTGSSAAFVPAGGISGGAVSLTRTNGDYVTMGNVLNFGTVPFSVSIWVNTTDTALDRFPVGKHQSGSGNGYFMNLNGTGGGGGVGKVMNYVSSVTNAPVSTTSVTDGNWHHLVGVFEPGVSNRVYVDGTPAEDARATNGVGANTVAFLVGGINAPGPVPLYTGRIDELRVYDHALTNPEIQLLFDCPAGVCPPTTTTTTTTSTTTTSTTSTTTSTTTTSTTTTTLEPLCDADPRTGCDDSEPGSSSIKLTVKGGTKNKLGFKLVKGDPSVAGDFGDPVGGSPEYALCIYDDSVQPQPRFATPIVGPFWKTAGTGYLYKDPVGNSGGITKVKLKPGEAGKTQVQVGGKGSLLAPPPPPLTGPVTAQFVARVGLVTSCWEVVCTSFTRNETGALACKGP